MSVLNAKAYRIETEGNHGYWQDRALAQIKVATQLSEGKGGEYDSLAERAADILLLALKEEKSISAAAAKEAEAVLLPLSEEAKAYTLHCVAHAHIDMNWMWRFDETVAITLDTFRTMLDLLKEYPQFTFSQSQASVYKIVEKFGSAGMLDEIRHYVKDGRWEVTASHWVENDKNLPNGESMARHLLYSKQYLTGLLNLPGDAVRLDFEPDTFGHSANLPEILAQAGVAYYYHCRGAETAALSWWRAPSGKRVLSYREPLWYNSAVNADFGVPCVSLCRENKTDMLLKVYGVGDHGGGPSRRDIERILDMQTWPVYPTLRFSTYHAFFDEVSERFGASFPEYAAEKNPVFTGCYTTQTRIKRANRAGESLLMEAELFAALAARSAGYGYAADRFEAAWEKVLFSQFHDILTGSCVADTREYAMGEFQYTAAIANTEKSNALRAIAAKIDTSQFISEINGEILEASNAGAGVGSGIAEFQVSQVNRAAALPQVFHVFNPSPHARTGLAEITAWDWNGRTLPLAEFRDETGAVIPFQVVKGGSGYWGHEFISLLLPVTVPAGGYTTVTLDKSRDSVLPPAKKDPGLLVEEKHEYVLENELVRIEFDTQTAAIVSYWDKQTQTEWICAQQPGGFRLIDEDPGKGLTSWRVGRYMNSRTPESVQIKSVMIHGAALRSAIETESRWGGSVLKAVYSLDRDSRTLTVDIDCDWHERATPGSRIPQLSFCLPLNMPCGEYLYDIPAGTIARQPADMDLPGNSFIAALPEGRTEGFLLSSDSKYGYRGTKNAVSVDLIRMSYDPDPAPEYGRHRIKLAAGPTRPDKARIARQAFDCWHPFNILSAPAHRGEWPLSGSLIELESDNAVLQAVKQAQDGSGDLVARIYAADGQGGRALLKLPFAEIQSARAADIHERPAGQAFPVENGAAALSFAAGELLTVRLKPRK